MKQEIKPIRRERERETTRFQNVIIPNYLYNEYKEVHTIIESNLYRYNKKEEQIKSTLKFFSN